MWSDLFITFHKQPGYGIARLGYKKNAMLTQEFLQWSKSFVWKTTAE
jgi:hypothetical protein